MSETARTKEVKDYEKREKKKIVNKSGGGNQTLKLIFKGFV